MKRLRLLLVLVACPVMYVTIAASHEQDISNQGGTVHGKIFGPTIIECPPRIGHNLCYSVHLLDNFTFR